MNTREFKVVTVSQNANGFGLHGHILIAKNGEAWEVCRSRGPWNSDVPFNKGDVVNVPVNNNRPTWAGLSVECPRQLPNAPYNVVVEVWGKEVADANTNGPEPKKAPTPKYRPSIVFTASQFKPYTSGHTTAEDKAKFANQLVKFIERGYQLSDFPKWFYLQLSMTFGHIAHYNQGGFYDHFFGGDGVQKIEGMIDFMQQCLLGGGHGIPEYTHCDVENAISRWATQQRLMEKLEALKNEIQMALDLSLRDKLVAQYGAGV